MRIRKVRGALENYPFCLIVTNPQVVKSKSGSITIVSLGVDSLRRDYLTA